MKLSISLGKPKQSTTTAPTRLPLPSVFAEAEDENENEDNSRDEGRGRKKAAAGSSATSSKNKHTSGAAVRILSLVNDTGADAGSALHSAQQQQEEQRTSRTLKKMIEAEKKVDETVYEYDEVWDKMQEAKMLQKVAKEADTKERKPKYIGNLLSSAATRKLDYLRAEEKMMQREREAEGDEFKDKEAFVTQAYKDQMAEVRKAEEEERKNEELKKKQGKSTGMAQFYRKLLEESEKQHEATVAATQMRVLGPTLPTSFKITRIDTPSTPLTGLDHPNTNTAQMAPFSDLELARAAREQGKAVELNDDNQIIDKRDLLTAGLNLSLPNTRHLALLRQKSSHPSSSTILNNSNGTEHRAAGSAASRREINERRARDIKSQLEEEDERRAEEQRREQEEAVKRVVVKRNNEEDVQSARERYLQRKRQRMLEEEQQLLEEGGEGEDAMRWTTGHVRESAMV